MGLETNRDIIIAQSKLAAAQARAYGAWSHVLPSLNVSLVNSTWSVQGDRVFSQDVPVGQDSAGTVIFERRETVQSGRSLNNFQLSTSAQLKLYDGLQSWNSIKQERQHATSALLELETVRNRAALNVISGYYEVLKSRQLEELYRRQLELNEAQIEQAQSLFENGMVGKGDVLRAQAQRNRGRVDWLKQRQAVLQSTAALNIALGRKPRADLALQDPVGVDFTPSFSPHPAHEALKRAVANNSEVLYAQSSTDAARLAEQIARGGYWPVVTGSVSYARISSELDRVYGSFGDNWGLNFGLNVSLNFLNGTLTKANLLQAQANRLAAEETLNQTVHQVELAIELAVLELETLTQILAMGRENMAAVEENIALAEELYRNGEGTLLDVIEARVSFVNTQTDLIGARYDFMVADANLQQALGSLFEDNF